MLYLIWRIFTREIRLAFTRLAESLQPAGFYLLIGVIFPMALSNRPETLSQIAPAVIWAGAVLSAMLAVPKLYADDWQEGTLEQYRLLPMPLEGVVIGKLLAFWCVYALPVVSIAPLVALILHDDTGTLVLLTSLALGMLGLVALASVVAALTVGFRQAGAMLALLILPLSLPIIIFGAHGGENQALWILLGSVCVITPASIVISAIALKEG